MVFEEFELFDYIFLRHEFSCMDEKNRPDLGTLSDRVLHTPGRSRVENRSPGRNLTEEGTNTPSRRSADTSVKHRFHHLSAPKSTFRQGETYVIYQVSPPFGSRSTFQQGMVGGSLEGFARKPS